ncbi:hypothetical protein NDU88_007166 [Pleurodeles waltl]|uniref:Uncharacterized protein n=1 Tax=Pleurodeles waltl TaxID=8319 RepID=A0AAV7PKU9_PLEWA|nr:hypothetical protein NDU88_007166 [Pleurodeles waltl]
MSLHAPSSEVCRRESYHLLVHASRSIPAQTQSGGTVGDTVLTAVEGTAATAARSRCGSSLFARCPLDYNAIRGTQAQSSRMLPGPSVSIAARAAAVSSCIYEASKEAAGRVRLYSHGILSGTPYPCSIAATSTPCRRRALARDPQLHPAIQAEPRWLHQGVSDQKKHSCESNPSVSSPQILGALPRGTNISRMVVGLG